MVHQSLIPTKLSYHQYTHKYNRTTRNLGAMTFKLCLVAQKLTKWHTRKVIRGSNFWVIWSIIKKSKLQTNLQQDKGPSPMKNLIQKWNITLLYETNMKWNLSIPIRELSLDLHSFLSCSFKCISFGWMCSFVLWVSFPLLELLANDSSSSSALWFYAFD